VPSPVGFLRCSTKRTGVRFSPRHLSSQLPSYDRASPKLCFSARSKRAENGERWISGSFPPPFLCLPASTLVEQRRFYSDFTGPSVGARLLTLLCVVPTLGVGCGVGMERTQHRLTPLKVARLTEAGYYADGAGLHLQVKGNSKSWVLFFSLTKRRREMGLGPFPEVSLAMARELAAEARTKVKLGLDPIEDRKASVLARSIEESRGITFEVAVNQFLSSRAEEWKNLKHRAQWGSTLRTYAFPVIGSMSLRLLG
jgi:hypothetical protein